MVNLSVLDNLSPLDLNTSILDNAATDLIPTMQVVANEGSDGYFTIGVLVAFFIFMMWMLFKQDDQIRLPIQKTLLLSSGLTTILGLLMLVLNFSNEIQPMLWFFVIFVISVLITYIMKSRGQA